MRIKTYAREMAYGCWGDPWSRVLTLADLHWPEMRDTQNIVTTTLDHDRRNLPNSDSDFLLPSRLPLQVQQWILQECVSVRGNMRCEVRKMSKQGKGGIEHCSPRAHTGSPYGPVRPAGRAGSGWNFSESHGPERDGLIFFWILRAGPARAQMLTGTGARELQNKEKCLI
jgi:hypothetical protein